MTSNTSSEPYREGYVAGASGRPATVPQKYALGTKEVNDWADGWADGSVSRSRKSELEPTRFWAGKVVETVPYKPPDEVKSLLQLKGRGFCFSDSAAFAANYTGCGYVLGFVADKGNLVPHAWFSLDAEHRDATDLSGNTKIMMYSWTHDAFGTLLDSKMDANGEWIPPRITRAGKVVFSEVVGNRPERLAPTEAIEAYMIKHFLFLRHGVAGIAPRRK